MVLKVISGGQTGVDQAGLEAAYQCGILTGGYAPQGYKTEIGRNDKLYTRYNLQVCNGGYKQRTKLNVDYSDGTILIYNKFSGGTSLTYNYCIEAHKPFVTVYITKELLTYDPCEPCEFINIWAETLCKWLYRENIFTVNIAGNRESKAVGIYVVTLDLLSRVFSGKV